MTGADPTPGRWSAERAWTWYLDRPWPVGCNFTPSTAVNQLEMWQAATFDRATIDRELGWAAGTGMNTVRAYLHDLVFAADPDGLLDRVDAFLGIADRHGIAPMLVLFDDCWHPPAPGPQPDPVPGVHNSRWAQSPGRRVVAEPREWPRLRRYVEAVVGRFADDPRVLAWDVYNEPANDFLPALSLPQPQRALALARRTAVYPAQRDRSLRLVDAAFRWARGARPGGPSQPLTAAPYWVDPKVTRFLVARSDVVSFHNYRPVDDLLQQVDRLRRHGRPLLCTEWMARPLGSRWGTHLPVFARERVGCWSWGLVTGRTQTRFGWNDPAQGSLGAPGGAEPGEWFHDLLHADGTPYDPEEVAVIRALTDRGAPSAGGGGTAGGADAQGATTRPRP